MPAENHSLNTKVELWQGVKGINAEEQSKNSQYFCRAEVAHLLLESAMRKSSELSRRMRGEVNSSPQASFSVSLVYHDPPFIFLEGFGIQRRHLASLFFTKPIGDTSEGHGTSSRRLRAFGYEILMAHHLALRSSSFLGGVALSSGEHKVLSGWEEGKLA